MPAHWRRWAGHWKQLSTCRSWAAPVAVHPDYGAPHLQCSSACTRRPPWCPPRTVPYYGAPLCTKRLAPPLTPPFITLHAHLHQPLISTSLPFFHLSFVHTRFFPWAMRPRPRAFDAFSLLFSAPDAGWPLCPLPRPLLFPMHHGLLYPACFLCPLPAPIYALCLPHLVVPRPAASHAFPTGSASQCGSTQQLSVLPAPPLAFPICRCLAWPAALCSNWAASTHSSCLLQQQCFPESANDVASLFMTTS